MKILTAGQFAKCTRDLLSNYYEIYHLGKHLKSQLFNCKHMEKCGVYELN